jgi:hypothetical protein
MPVNPLLPGQTLVPNMNSELNKGCIAWWLALPNMIGGGAFIDLMGRFNLTLNVPGTVLWKGATRDWGWGSLSTPGAANASAKISYFQSFNSEASIFAWVRPVTAATLCLIVCSGDGGAGNSGILGLTAAAKIRGGWGSSNNLLTGTKVFSNNTWAHIGWTRTGSAGAWQGICYANGLSDSTTSSIATNPGAAHYGFALGEQIGAGAQQYSGLIDDVSVWNRALRPAEVYALYQESKANYPNRILRVSKWQTQVTVTTTNRLLMKRRRLAVGKNP